ncbi:uncharacterized protein DUF2759 [Bacillus thuringiensis]|uniref:Uncharacterized protein DUF2759 n=1 Tax=Bacillus thuringiensis TaxID=1428 RepID=A0A4R4BDY1_BACTU|nr:uncharacterized protein DUF2759 [Bacillus thuringiensis]TCW52573.1 uncharacterized protein DUF2759 [Bacillus thuringiensis]
MLSRQSFLKHVQYKRVNILKTHIKEWVDRGGYCMGLVIIFALVTLLAVFATLRTLREKNLFAGGFAIATVLVFGWFTIMTVLYSGYPPAA